GGSRREPLGRGVPPAGRGPAALERLRSGRPLARRGRDATGPRSLRDRSRLRAGRLARCVRGRARAVVRARQTDGRAGRGARGSRGRGWQAMIRLAIRRPVAVTMTYLAIAL